MFAQTITLQEEKDSSKNLVSGDFEREYTNGMMQKPVNRRRSCLVALIAMFSLVVVWLLGLTVVRELQIQHLRQELAQLSANIIALEASFKGLNQKVTNNKFFNEFQSLGDTFYADMDEEQIPVEDSSPDKKEQDSSDYNPLKKLDVLTVLEDADDFDEDDEDYDTDEDVESGDFYSDYDKRREKIGRTNMEKLTPEDFIGSPVTIGNGKDKNSNSVIRQIKKLLNENPEAPDTVLAAATASGSPSSTGARTRRSVFPDSPLDSVDEFAAPRSLIKPDDRQAPKKSSRSDDSLLRPKFSSGHATRRTRDSDDEATEHQRRPFIAAHFHGNTSHLSTDIHEHYKGNGLIRLSHGAHHDVWWPSGWTQAVRTRPTLRDGHVMVHHAGVYLVYVQIYYLDSHDVIAWVLHRTNPEMEGRETLLQCAQSSHSPEPRDKPNSCFSAAALYLRAGDRLVVRNTGGDRHSVMQPEKSFIGLVQLADTTYSEHEL